MFSINQKVFFIAFVITEILKSQQKIEIELLWYINQSWDDVKNKQFPI